VAKWLNRSLIQAPRNGTNAHTVTFTPPAAGNLLLALVEGPVTSTTPTGWILQASAINNTGLYAWTKTATAAESSFTTTHNGSNYPIGVVVYEFAAGSAWVAGVSSTGGSAGAPNPMLSGLSGANLLFGAVGDGNATGATISAVWSATPSPVADVAVSELPVGTDGYWFGVAYAEDSTAASYQPTATLTNPGGTKEALTFAVNVYVAPVDPTLTDIAVTATLATRSWSATITPRTSTGTLDTRRWDGRLE
jgi:hypothetical protein